jgi:zinc/manganese transport system substrate-binding protein
MKLSVFACLSTFLGIGGILSPPALRVVTSTQDLGSIVKAIGQERVQVTSIVTGARDPHKIQAKPSYMSLLRDADLFIAIGLDLEVGWESAILQGSRNSAIRIGGRGHYYASTGVPVLDKPAVVSRALGDVHPYGNPHIWTDPYNARIMARGIANKLAELDPSNAPFYRTSANRFIEQIDRKMFGPALVERVNAETLWEWQSRGVLLSELRSRNLSGQLGGWASTMEPLRGTPVITYHRSLNYFAHRFGLEIVAELEPKPGIDPTPGHLASVVQIAKQRQVKVILQEPYYSTRHGEFVASRVGARVVIIPLSVGNVPEAVDYISLIDTLVSRVSSALGG